MNKLKIYISRLLFFIVILIFATPSIYTFGATEPPPLDYEGATSGATLMDATTGQVLYSKNGDTQYFPASTTKILTALLVFENAKLDDKITIGKNPPFADGTSIGIKTDEIFTVRELLLGLLLESGNDCAEALAEHVSGSCKEFAKLMNERAKELGAKNSNFKNPSGLPDPEHVTTSNDLSLIMKELIKIPEFLEIERTTTLHLPASNLGEQRWINNGNKILLKGSTYYYPFSIASKKGYTVEATFANVMAATKNGHTLIATSLKGKGIDTVYADAKNLMNYGFDNFTKVKLYSEGDIVDSISLSDGTSLPLLAGKDVYYTTKTSEKDNLEKTINYTQPTDLNNKALTRGETLTTGKVFLNGENLEDIDLASGISREYNTKIAIKAFYKNHTTAIFLLGGGFILVFLIRFMNKQRRLREKIRRSKLDKIINK